MRLMRHVLVYESVLRYLLHKIDLKMMLKKHTMWIYIINFIILSYKIYNVWAFIQTQDKLCACDLHLPLNRCICNMKFVDLEAKED